jgi:hypothetical protein
VHLFMHDRPAYPMLHINWAMGYLEALNFSALTHGEDTRQIFLPSTELDRLLVNYCRLHPDDEVAFGVVKLYEQMPIIPGSQAEISAEGHGIKKRSARQTTSYSNQWTHACRSVQRNKLDLRNFSCSFSRLSLSCEFAQAQLSQPRERLPLSLER